MTKRVLITGANKGIGKATVAAVLQADPNAYVYLGSRDRERGEAARADLVAEDGSLADRITVLAIDVSKEASVTAAGESLRKEIGSEPGTLYGIINNAGIGLGDQTMRAVLEVNTYGPKRVFDAFVELLAPNGGRVVNVSSASGPNFVAKCAPERQRLLTDPNVTWDQVEALMKECLALAEQGGDFGAAGLGDGSAYGISKACLNAYTIAMARQHPKLVINACTPGFIETDLTAAFTRGSGKSGREMGMKSPAEGTRASVHLLLGDPGGSGWYFGSDAQRSPLDRYRSPGDPPYSGD